uniref:SAP domain-containing protein n=1 Tax=Bracon brevicornis TaxID=1563983 RepID=A0A6V7JLB5_9HYME
MDPTFLTVVELKAELRRRELSVTGSKVELIEIDPTRGCVAMCPGRDGVPEGDDSPVEPPPPQNPPFPNPNGEEHFRNFGVDLMRREVELLRRQLDLAHRENQYLRQAGKPRVPLNQNITRRENINSMLELIGNFDGSPGTFEQ